MKARAYTPNADYVEIATWWVDRTGVIPAKDLLSKRGVIVETDAGIPLAFVSVYGASAAAIGDQERVAFLGFPATNPAPEHAFATHEALLLAVRVACAQVTAAGCAYVVAYTDVRAAKDAYVKAGLVECSKGTLSDFVLKVG